MAETDQGSIWGIIPQGFSQGQDYVALRGGNWNNGGNAGVFALNLNNAPSNSNNNVGFRLGK